MEDTINTDDATTQELRAKSERLLETANDALECGDFERADVLVDEAAKIDTILNGRDN